MKKFVSFLLLAAMLLSMSVVAMAEGETSQEIFRLVKIDNPTPSIVGNQNNNDYQTIANMLSAKGLTYNDSYCYTLQLEIDNYSGSLAQVARFSVSANKPNVKALVAYYMSNFNGNSIISLSTSRWSSSKVGKNCSDAENPFSVPTTNGTKWFQVPNGNLVNNNDNPKWQKLFVAVDPTTVTEDTILTVAASAYDQESYTVAPLVSLPIELKAYVAPEQTNTQISTTNGEITTEFDTLEAAVAAASTTTNTTFTVPAGTEIAGITVPANSTVSVSSSESSDSGNVTVKQASVTYDGGSSDVYVISNGTNTTAISSDKMSTNFGNYNSSTAADISDNINVAQVLSGAVSDGLDISSMTSMELSLAKDTEPSLSAIEASADYVSNIGDKTIAVKAEVHPIVKITTGTGDQKTTTTRAVSNEELKENVKFHVSVPGLSSTKTYTIYHFGKDGTLKETFTEQTPDNLGMVYVDLSSFSYLLAVESGYADPASTEVIFYGMQGNFGNSYEFTVRLKVPNDSYVPSLNLGGFRPLSESTVADYASSKVVAYTLVTSSDENGYYYTYQIKLFAKFLNTPIYFTVTHDNEAVAISPIAADKANFMHTSGSSYGYSMADYVGLLSQTDSSYSGLYQQIRSYADAVLAKFPNKT